ncbi:hypothetical protein M407DRAFT_25249 [Tulasnella calospora MUT 4182]|uniref:Uncharacterized protein n=1 Tax=Tulasnella calospora MUT 4182 TaxID=1051891 RepID=A0A0C3LVP1_9AGAM|nr:hypothetical protein M407DRAFT_25249 [Tulasnella calospora MUT 4182]
MPKASIQKTSRLSPKTNEYLQRLRDIKEEYKVIALIEPQYQYPSANQVYTAVHYIKPNGKPYDFTKRKAKATQHTRIDITHCPSTTLAYLIDNFPKSEVSFTRTNLLIPYTPVTQTIARAYQVLPIDTVVEYDSV